MTDAPADAAPDADPPQDRPPVTLAVKTYRQADLAERAVRSAFAQTYAPLEILLSDDASPDGTYALLERLAAEYDGPHRVRLNRNPRNLGVVGHENRMWELATGRLMAQCAGDDIAEPDRIERLVAAWRAGQGGEADGDVMLVHSSVMQIDGAGRPLGLRAPKPEIVADPSPANVLRAETNCIGATALYDRRLWERFGPIPLECGVEDGPMFFRAGLLGRIAYVDAPLVRYAVDGLSRSDATRRGVFHLRGSRILSAAWWHANAGSFLRDLARMPPTPEREALRQAAQALRERDAVELRVWRASPLGRWALLPWAAWRGWRAGDATLPVKALKQALGRVYIWWYTRRWGDSWEPTDP